MGRCIWHVGMPKAGSSSVQAWLGRESQSERWPPALGVVGAIDVSDHGSVVVTARRGGPVNSGSVVGVYLRADEVVRQRILADLYATLSGLLETTSQVILSSEAFTQWLWRKEQPFAAVLRALSEAHDVVIVYYVRPQDGALEAAWRQWGFRTGDQPSRYIRWRSRQMHYSDTIDWITDVAPNVDLRVRPFRRDLLESGDVVADFVRHGLGLDAGRFDMGVPDSESNRGLPLAVVNLLAGASKDLVGDPHDNQRIDLIKRLVAGLEVADDDRILRSRVVLRAYAHRLFEASNRELIAAQGWPTGHFIEDVDDTSADDLDDLDALWLPDMGDSQRRYLDALLGRLITATVASS